MVNPLLLVDCTLSHFNSKNSKIKYFRLSAHKCWTVNIGENLNISFCTFRNSKLSSVNSSWKKRFQFTIVWWIQVTPKAVTTSDLEPKITFRVDKFQDGFQLGCTLTKWCFWPETTDGGGDEERLVSRNNNNQLDYYIALFGLTLGSQPWVHWVGIWDLRYVYFDIHVSPNFFYPGKYTYFSKQKLPCHPLFSRIFSKFYFSNWPSVGMKLDWQ